MCCYMINTCEKHKLKLNFSVKIREIYIFLTQVTRVD